MRDLLMFGAMLFWVPLALGDVFVAYLLWEWLAIISPQYFLFSFMGELRYGLIFAVITLFLMVFGKKSLPGRFQSTRTGNLLLLFLTHASLCAAFAYSPNPLNGEVYFNLAKTLVYVLLMPLLVNDRTRLHAMLIMIALGVGFQGVQEGVKFLVTGGAYPVNGIPSTMLSDNNHFAMGINMGIPILFYLYQYSEKKWVKFGFLLAMLITVAAVVGTRSRGGFIALSMIGVFLVMGSRHKLLSLVLVLLGGGLVLLLGSESWLERISSIKEAGEDISFMGRVASWNVNTAIAMANPLFGGGFHVTNMAWIWHIFDSSHGLFSISGEYHSETGRAAHSIYFEVLGDMGFAGFLIFIAILINAIVTRFEITRMCKTAGQELVWARDMADAMMISLLAYMVGGAGVSLGYYDLLYIIAILLELLKRTIQQRAEAATAKAR